MKEAVIPEAIIRELLRAAGPNLVLVGGQAFAYWMGHYGVEMPATFAAVSRDIDFLTQSAADRDQVRRLARVLAGEPYFPRENELTALVGQAIRPIGDDEYLNVDVIFNIYEASASAIREAALEVTEGDVVFRVMHPLDVLKSRLDNLYGLAEKQTELGRAQLRAAIAVASKAQVELMHRTQSLESPRRSPTLAWGIWK